MAHPDAVTASSRYGLGPRPGELAAIGDDPRGWLESQLDRAEPTPGLDALPASAEAVRAFVTARGENERRAVREAHRTLYTQECASWMQTATASQQPFRERLVAFFANHFTVSIARPEITGIVGGFVREAIRPHVTGRFVDLLVASTRHPAMLTYLDNIRSVGPNSRAGRARGKGLNENLAREILELHTLGVDGGYTQADVEGFAAMLTGWGVAKVGRSGPEIAGTFTFSPRRHEPGPKTLLSTRFPEAGEQEASDALELLARHPATARFVSTKLARHFVSDTPPPDAVAALERTFIDTEGDLAEVARTLVHLDGIWKTPHTKLRTPFDLVLAGARALEWEEDGAAMRISLEMLGQPLHGAPSPEGWPDTASEWLGPDALLSRLEWATLLAEQSIDRVPDPEALVADTVGPLLSFTTRRTFDRAERPVDQLALLIASPEFQRR